MDSDPNTNSFVRVWGAPSRTAEGKRRGRRGIPGGCSSPVKGWAETGLMAPPLAQSSPPRQGGESPREGKGLRNKGDDKGRRE